MLVLSTFLLNNKCLYCPHFVQHINKLSRFLLGFSVCPEVSDIRRQISGHIGDLAELKAEHANLGLHLLYALCFIRGAVACHGTSVHCTKICEREEVAAEPAG